MLKRIKNQWNDFSRWISELIPVGPATNASSSSAENSKVCSLPIETERQLKKRLAQLPPPEPYVSEIHNAISKAVTQWTHGSTNCLALLASSTEDLPQILTAALGCWECPVDSVKQWWLPWSARSPDPMSLGADLQQTLSNQITMIQVEMEQSPSRPLVVIPCLEQCFLRHADGLEAIGTLTEIIATHRQYFWLVGCNEWAWAYLKRVCHLSAYCDTCWSLPPLDGDAIREWLIQAMDRMDVDFANPLEEAVEASASQVMGLTDDHLASYFNRLASLSDGLATTAAQLWLKSLEVPVASREAESRPSDAQMDREPEAETRLQIGSPSLPKLPSLDTADRYLLHAVVLHGTMTLPELVLTLADPIEHVQAHLQPLFRAGVLQEQQHSLKISPIYYPQIRSDLKHNNFLLEVDS